MATYKEIITMEEKIQRLEQGKADLQRLLIHKDNKIKELERQLEKLKKNVPLYENKESKWTIIPFTALCSIDGEKSNINGKYVEQEDFVNKYDHAPDKAEPYGCGDMRAEVIPATPEVLNKYEISLGDYQIIANEIATAVSFGECGWCI